MAPSTSLAAYAGAAVLFAARMASAQNFTIANGQIYTPGLAIVNAPQPGTPLGGGTSPNFTPQPQHDADLSQTLSKCLWMSQPTAASSSPLTTKTAPA